ncbi:MAG: hypothetical protein LBJ73_01245 [Rickettsiales bacterium]|jgi:hypothetical protein|nr:hypothetical protein [Rickettsiales bacterium]
MQKNTDNKTNLSNNKKDKDAADLFDPKSLDFNPEIPNIRELVERFDKIKQEYPLHRKTAAR